MDFYSYRTDSYFKGLEKLSARDQEQVDLAFKRWVEQDGATARGVNIHPDVLSVKVSEGTRVLGMEIETLRPNTRAVVWFFVGKHSDYEHMLKAQRLQGSLGKIKDRLGAFRSKMEREVGLVKGPDPERDSKARY